MKKNFNYKVSAGLIALAGLLLVFTAGTALTGTTEKSPAPAAPQTPAAAPAATTPDGKRSMPLADESLYTAVPRSLTPVECGSCHPGEYKLLRESESKHRFFCTDCHQQLHAYVPTKDNYASIMPQCADCHELPHGEPFTMCKECHQDPHTPLDIPFEGVSKNYPDGAGKEVVACEVCHYETEGKEFADNPTKHNEEEVGCTGCHADKHGYRPTCFDCHDPHVEGQPYEECLVCHRPHSAKNILPYPEETDNKVCGSCHDEVFDNLQVNLTKHSELQCATCHTVHGEIPKCQDCHESPHGKKMHKKFADCLECHVDPHNMPVEPEKEVE